MSPSKYIRRCKKVFSGFQQQQHNSIIISEMLSCGCGRKLRCNLPVDDEEVAPSPTMKEAARAVVDLSAAVTAAVKERANRPLKDT